MFSAVHPITDFAKILRHFRFVPTSDIALPRDQTVRDNT
jgi:hypothetical protein